MFCFPLTKAMMPIDKTLIKRVDIYQSISDKRNCPNTFEVCIVPARLAKRISRLLFNLPLSPDYTRIKDRLYKLTMRVF